MGSYQRKNARAQERKRQADPVRAATMWIHSCQDGDGCAQGRDLRKREVYEDHSPFHHVYPQVRMDSGEDEAGDERKNEELKDLHSTSSTAGRIECLDQQGNVVVEQLEVVGYLFFAAH